MRALLARVDAVLVQAVIAGALSFAHLHEIAAAAGQDGWKAWAYPISVDLLMVAAWRRLRSDRGGSRAVGWCWFLIALAASLGANIATAGLLDLDDVPAWLRVLIAGWPAVAFLGGTLLAHQPTPTNPDADHDQEAVPEPGPEQAALGDHQAHEQVADPVPALSGTGEHVQALTPDPAPELTDTGPCRPAVPVPAALVQHARTVAAQHRARTGAPIDAATLRARLGVPASMADAIATQLTQGRTT